MHIAPNHPDAVADLGAAPASRAEAEAPSYRNGVRYVAFIKEPHDSDAVRAFDVHQGHIGSCVLGATLQGVSLSRQGVRFLHKAIRYLGEDKWGVKLFNPRGNRVEIAVSRDEIDEIDKRLRQGDQSGITTSWQRAKNSRGTTVEIWPQLFEIAYIKMRGQYSGHWEAPLDQGLGIVDRGAQLVDGLRAVLGNGVQSNKIDPEEIKRATERGQVVTIARDSKLPPPGWEQDDYDLIERHAYAVTSVRPDEVRYLNPWGTGIYSAVSRSTFKAFFTHAAYATIPRE